MPRIINAMTMITMNVQWWKSPRLQVPSTASSADNISIKGKDNRLEAGNPPAVYWRKINMHTNSASANISDSGNSKRCVSIIFMQIYLKPGDFRPVE